MGGFGLPELIVIGSIGFILWVTLRGIKKAADKYPPAAPEQNTVSGVGGWLLLLVLGLMFIGPLIGAGRINMAFESIEDQFPNLKSVAEWGTYKSSTWWTFLLASCLSFYAGLGLVRERSVLAVKRAKIILWIAGPLVTVILEVLLPVLIFKKFETNPQFLGNLIPAMIGAAIWTAYLSKSKRVKTTYGCNTPSA